MALNLITYSNAFGCTPLLGGSRIIVSGLSLTFFIISATSPARNSQLFKLFNLAFSFAASTASSISSIPTTFFAFAAAIWPIVPVPQ